jgi:glucose uptake protein
VAVGLCFITMLCWGSWANTLKLASKEWPFPLYYWDYALGLVLTSVLLGLTIGSTGGEGRGFVADLERGAGGGGDPRRRAGVLEDGLGPERER